MSKLTSIVLCSCLLLSLTGCDQIRSKISDLIAPETPEQALSATKHLAETGQSKQALDKALIHADTASPLRGEFAWIVARISAQNRDTEMALKYLSHAMDALGLSSADVMSDASFTYMHTDVRFLQVITNQTTTTSRSESSVATPSQAGQTQIKMDSHGTEVRAGDIVIKLPN